MNRIIALLLAFTIVVSGCGSTVGENVSKSNEDEAVEQTIEIVEDNVKESVNDKSSNSGTTEDAKEANTEDSDKIDIN